MHTKTYIFTFFYQQYLVLFTMVPRDSIYQGIEEEELKQPRAKMSSIRRRGVGGVREACAC